MKQKIINGIFIILSLVSFWGVLKTGWLRNSPDYLLSLGISSLVLIMMATTHLVLANRLKSSREKVVLDIKDEIKNFPKTVFNAVSEELIFRGMITYLIAYAAGLSYGVIFGTLIFVLVHRDRDKFTIIYSLIMGLGLGFCVVYARDIIFPIMAHVLFNVFGGGVKTVNKEQKDVIIQ